MIEDIKTIYQMIKPHKGIEQKERIENFYRNQSENYDCFREKLLSGRQILFQSLHQECQSGVWVDFGAGTGALLDSLTNQQISQYKKIYLVDISNSLLAQAKLKIEKRGLGNVEIFNGDIESFKTPKQCQIVSFSYALTMLPQWFKALDQSFELLSSDGIIGSVDFYISEKFPISGLQPHSFKTRFFWPLWFAYDNVFLNPDHLPYLLNKFEKIHLFEGFNSLPFLPVGKVPFYYYIGRKV